MQYILLLHVDEAGWPKLTKAEQEQGMAAYIAYSEALSKAGALIGTNRLQPNSTATTTYPISMLRSPGAARCPAAGHGVVEARPLMSHVREPVNA